MTLRYLLSTVMSAALLSGCLATTGPERPTGYGPSGAGDPPSSSGASDQTRTRVEGTAFGAVIGGLLGAVIGRDAKGAAIGAALGAGLGYVVGNEVAKRKAKYASTEDFLNAEIQQTVALNDNAARYNAQLRHSIAALERESEVLAARYRAGKVSRGRLLAQRKEVQQRLQTSKRLEQDLRKEHDVNVAIIEDERRARGRADPQVAALEKQVRQLQTNIEALQRGSTQLAKIDERLSL